MAKALKGYKRLPGHKYRTPDGKIITEYRYRTIKAKRSGFRNYTQQRRIRESQPFMKMRFDALRHDQDADVGPGSKLERAIVEFLTYRETSGASMEGPVPGYRAFPGPQGWPAPPGTGAMIGVPGREFAEVLEAMGLPDYWKWRYWYSEVKVG